MKDETVRASEAVPTDQERLMALLALTVQELPQSSRTADAVANNHDPAENEFRRLDADPAALEAYLRRGMRKLSASESVSMRWRNAMQLLASWLAPPGARFVAAASVVLVTGVVVFWQMRAPELLGVVEQSYAQSKIDLPKDGLTLPWERQPAVQGFATIAGNDTPAGRAFAHGLLRGRARLQGAAIPVLPIQIKATAERFVALGEWNILLWSACTMNRDQTIDFWRAQLSLAHWLTAKLAADSDQLVTNHATLMENLIADMVREPGARNAKRLSEELARFREAYAPLQMSASLPTP